MIIEKEPLKGNEFQQDLMESESGKNGGARNDCEDRYRLEGRSRARGNKMDLRNSSGVSIKIREGPINSVANFSLPLKWNRGLPIKSAFEK